MCVGGDGGSMPPEPTQRKAQKKGRKPRRLGYDWDGSTAVRIGAFDPDITMATVNSDPEDQALAVAFVRLGEQDLRAAKMGLEFGDRIVARTLFADDERLAPDQWSTVENGALRHAVFRQVSRHRIAGQRQYSPLIRPGTVWTIRSMTQAGSWV